MPVVRSRKKMAASMDPECGHSGCGRECNVTYAGPVSLISHHHALHAARGVAHIWTAVIMTGFAIVVTGAVAMSAAQASTEKADAERQTRMKEDIGAQMRELDRKLGEVQALVQSMSEKCFEKAVVTSTSPSVK